MRAVAGVVVMSMLALAACSKKAADGAPAAEAGKPAASAAAGALPMPKAGKWKMTMSMSQMPQPVVTEVCLDAAALKDMKVWGQSYQKDAGVSCSEQSVRREGADVVSHSVCTMNGTKVTTDSRASGDFNSRYTTTVTSKMDPDPTGTGATVNTVVSEYQGAC